MRRSRRRWRASRDRSDESTWILDTGIIVHVLRGSPLGGHLIEDHQLRARNDVPLLSVVSIGELLSLARQFNWGVDKIQYMQEVVGELVIVDINSQPVLEAYAEIDAWGRSKGLSLGKNDLWIAASAAATNSTLLTADKDFDPLQQFIHRIYFDPAATYASKSVP